MRAKKFACCLMVMSLLAGISFISCGNSSRAKVESEAAQTGEDFKSFLDKFTSSAAFQYTRVKFPLKTPVTLLADDGETEKTFPFTKEKWPLLDSETLKEERISVARFNVFGVALLANTAAILAQRNVKITHKIHTDQSGVPPMAKWETAPVKAVKVIINTLVPTAVFNS